MIVNNCKKESIAVLVSAPIKIDALSKVNSAYQNNFVWMTYHKRDDQLLNGMTSFFVQILSYFSLRCSAIEKVAKTMLKLGKYRIAELQYSDLFFKAPERNGIEHFIGKIDPFLEPEVAYPAITLWQYPRNSHYTAYNYAKYILKATKTKTTT